MFEKIIGNEPIKEMLKKSIEKKTTSHSYLFVGIQGIGKKQIAIEMAKKILCENIKEDTPCKSCIEFESSNNPDYMYIEPEGNSIKIEQIRFMQKKIQEKPIISSKKVYIIDEAQTMTIEAQNCLLKTLEEPPAYAVIILIGSNENAFLATIKSRCMILHFQPIEDEKIQKYIKENQNLENVSKNYISIAQGSIAKAIKLKNKQEEYKKIENMIENLNQKDIIEISKMGEELYKAKEEIFEILEYINIILLNKAKENNIYTNCILIVEETKKRLKQNANYDMSIDNLLFNMWEEVNSK